MPLFVEISKHHEEIGKELKNIGRALVTGGAGFIGSHIVDELIAQQIETYVIDNLSSGSLENLKIHRNRQDRLFHLLIGDIRDLINEHEELTDIDIVFHEAATTSVPQSVENPLLIHENNVTNTLRLLDFCLKKDVRRFVFASSAAVYGEASSKDSYPAYVKEESTCRPSSPYGASKLAVENYLNAYRVSYGLETVILRYFNVYGTRQTNGSVVKLFMNQLLSGAQLSVFGDGTHVRDFVNVKDIVQANLLAATSKKGIGEIFNIASGKPTTLTELLAILRLVTGIADIQYHFESPRTGDISISLASIEKAKEYLGYDPRISIYNGLAEVLDEFREIQTKVNRFCEAPKIVDDNGAF